MISNKFLERLFQCFAGVLIILAVYFYLNGQIENVFITAVFGSLCFFIGIRFQVKERLEARAEESEKNMIGEGRYTPSAAREQFEESTFETDNRE